MKQFSVNETLINLNKVLGHPPKNVPTNTVIIQRKPVVKPVVKSKIDAKERVVTYIKYAERVNARCAMSGFVVGQIIYYCTHLNPIYLAVHEQMYTSLFFTDVSIIAILSANTPNNSLEFFLEYEMLLGRMFMLIWGTHLFF